MGRSQGWVVDATYRPGDATPEIEVEPDGTVEMAFEKRIEDRIGCLTLLLEPGQASDILDRLLELRVMGLIPAGVRNAG